MPGSPTWVREIRSLARTRNVEIIDGASAEEKAARLIDRLESRGAFITKTGASEIAAFDAPGEVAGDREVWAVAELMNGELRQVSFELLGKGIELARKLNARLAAVVAGVNVGNHVKALAAHGASRVYVADDERLARYSTFDYTSVLVDAINTHNPMTVLFGSTSNGRDLAPRIAARLSLGLTADCIDLDIQMKAASWFSTSLRSEGTL